MNTKGADLLRIAIIKQACNDFINAYRTNKKGNEVIVLKRFFKSEWFKELIQNDNFNSDSFIKKLEVKSDYEVWRKLHGCGHCWDKTCYHSRLSKRNGTCKYGFMEFALHEPICKKNVDMFQQGVI